MLITILALKTMVTSNIMDVTVFFAKSRIYGIKEGISITYYIMEVL